MLWVLVWAGCGETVALEAPGAPGVPEGGVARVAAKEPPEPWQELTPRAPGLGEFLAADPRTPNLDLKGLRVASRPPPEPRRPAPALRKPLLEMMVQWQRGDESAARGLAGRILADRRLRTRDLSALASLGCVPCSLTAVDELRRRISARGWAWKEARWLLPLAGHSSEQVRAAVLRAFLWARTELETQVARRRLETFLRVFRYLAADPSPWVRAEALSLLGRLKDRSAHRLLVAATGDRFPVVRLAAVEAIAEAIRLVPGAPSTKRVCGLLADPSPAVRAAVLEVLPRTHAPCPVSRVVALLEDRARAGLRFGTDQSGSQGRRGRKREVREAAFDALPPVFRAGIRAGATPSERIATALETIRRIQPGLLGARAPGSAVGLRPMRPLPAKLPGSDSGPELGKRLATVLRAGKTELSRRLLATQPLQQMVAQRLARLPESTVVALLEACDVPLRSQLLAAVVGLLAHGQAEVRYAALSRLEISTLDDRRPPVLTRALWLARRDPHPMVRRQALALVAEWHRGPAVQSRVVRALFDPHPAVRHQAVLLALDVAPGPARRLLPRRLAVEAPLVRAELLLRLVRRPALRPAAARVARYLDDAHSDRLTVTLGGRSREVGGSFGTVRGALLSALERTFGRRHRGPEPIRAKRWQDDLLRLGWKLRLSRPAD